jgi:hypothetical protein
VEFFPQQATRVARSSFHFKKKTILPFTSPHLSISIGIEVSGDTRARVPNWLERKASWKSAPSCACDSLHSPLPWIHTFA